MIVGKYIKDLPSSAAAAAAAVAASWYYPYGVDSDLNAVCMLLSSSPVLNFSVPLEIVTDAAAAAADHFELYLLFLASHDNYHLLKKLISLENNCDYK